MFIQVSGSQTFYLNFSNLWSRVNIVPGRVKLYLEVDHSKVSSITNFMLILHQYLLQSEITLCPHFSNIIGSPWYCIMSLHCFQLLILQNIKSSASPGFRACNNTYETVKHWVNSLYCPLGLVFSVYLEGLWEFWYGDSISSIMTGTL